MRNKKSYGVNIGTSSILVIIVILCLICFAGLSIVSANADFKLSEKLADRTTSYYAATSRANEDLAAIDKEFAHIYQESTGEKDYFAKIKESYSDSLTFDYSINDMQSLIVTINPVYPSNLDGDFFTVSRFQIVTTDEPEMDQSLPVFTSN